LPQKILIGVNIRTSATRAGFYDSAGRLIAKTSPEAPIHYPQPRIVKQKTRLFNQAAARAVML